METKSKRNEKSCFGSRQGSERFWFVTQSTDQTGTSPYSCAFSPGVSDASPPDAGPPLPPGAAGTCGSSPPPPPRTYWARRSWRWAGRRWSREASKGYGSGWAGEVEKKKMRERRSDVDEMRASRHIWHHVAKRQHCTAAWGGGECWEDLDFSSYSFFTDWNCNFFLVKPALVCITWLMEIIYFGTYFT